ncbi:portal_HK97, phage portal protein, HK97 family [uncultured Caudovirales phage]|uniref:Portal_HK97, phage portal protein, HK97 family n=1 Tax=uncultured Caudovirales phage TaxID=2100421 RepID=A0A6J5M9P2_9CAUD|nr:portal_HK97, phage portal protein, HK97 family [uncultured Caudovirales phage]CAB4159857.1 portal_HK97, phage portal protein, HK97 family [uncultured Caudovirales phage]
MGLFNVLFPQVEAAKPQLEVDAASVAPYYTETSPFFFAGITQATRAEAVSIPAVSRSIGIIQTIASLPMHVRNVATGEKVQAPRVINQPDPRIAGSVFWSWLISDLILHPSAYAFVTERYADTGRIRAMERIAPERVSIQTDGMGFEIVAYQVDGSFVDPNNLVVFQGDGEGLLNRAGRTIKAAAALERSAMNFANEPIPQMILKSNGTSLPADRVAKLLSSWRTARANKSTAFLNADVTLETLGYDPKSIQLNEARNYVALELARACGLPAYFVDAQQSTFTYSNALDKRRDLVDFAFRNYMSQIEQRLSFADFVPAGQEVKFDLDDFLRGNPYERAQVYEILNRVGAMSVEEIREEEDMLL